MFRKRRKMAAAVDGALVRGAGSTAEPEAKFEKPVTTTAQASRIGLRLDPEEEPILRQNTIESAAPLTCEDADDRGVDQPVTHDHRAIMERNEEIGKKILAGELSREEYRGRGAYAPILSRREGALAANKYTGSYGPLRATNVAFTRVTTRMDYNPELCKDYNETGYCGFGDTCKFIHDRYDYKSGWQLENEWEKSQKKKEAIFKARLGGRKLSLSSSGSDYED